MFIITSTILFFDTVSIFEDEFSCEMSMIAISSSDDNLMFWCSYVEKFWFEIATLIVCFSPFEKTLPKEDKPRSKLKNNKTINLNFIALILQLKNINVK